MYAPFCFAIFCINGREIACRFSTTVRVTNAGPISKPFQVRFTIEFGANSVPDG